MIFSILAFLTLFISICIKDRQKSLKVQSINCICESAYALTVGAYTGSMLGLINFIRSSLFIKKEKFSRKKYLLLLFIFEGVIILNCIGTWNGIISLLPTVASIIRTYSLWQTNMKYVRMSGIVSGALFGLYYIYYQSWFMVAGYLLLLAISYYNVCTVDLKHEALKVVKVK